LNRKRSTPWSALLLSLIMFPAPFVLADGGYFSRQSVAVSADQRVIIIKNGSEISVTISTGYTGEGEDFGWIIPTPVPPAVEDIKEAGKSAEAAFKVLDEWTAPVVITSSGCFPSGTEVLTADGPRAIETIEPGARVEACDLVTGEWSPARVLKRLSIHYEGDVITLQAGLITIRATGNHPFYVLRGDGLDARPAPLDVPKEEQESGTQGRWVEARDLERGDMLAARSGEDVIVTGLSSRQERIEVFNLEVEGHHTYAVHRQGILVHNKGSAEAAPTKAVGVTVYGRMTLEHYEVSILGAAGASPLLRWLQENGYDVNPAADKVLDSYIRQNWFFVAVKLKPGEKRHYANEFLPPLTIRYRHDRLVFPLHISSISTTQTAKITLYVIADSTVSSSNFRTRPLSYKNRSHPESPESYLESCIRKTAGKDGRGLVVVWRGEMPADIGRHSAFTDLLSSPFPANRKPYLTRLEARMGPAALTEDIRFILDRKPRQFQVDYQPTSARVTWVGLVILAILIPLALASASAALGVLGGVLLGLYHLVRLLVLRFPKGRGRR